MLATRIICNAQNRILLRHKESDDFVRWLSQKRFLAVLRKKHYERSGPEQSAEIRLCINWNFSKSDAATTR